MSLTPEDERIFAETLRTGNLDYFTESYFRLPWSGTWFTTEDRPEQYEMLHDIWVEAGKPDTSFKAILDEKEQELKVMWDAHYGGYPMILVPHGFRTLPWLKELVSPDIGLAIAVTGSGSGKAQPLDASVLTPTGWRRMGDLAVGDRVMGADGCPKSVLGVYPQGLRPIYRLTFDDGSSCEADDEHLWLVDDGKGRHTSLKVLPTSVLERRQRNYIFLASPMSFDGHDLPLDPYLVGALIGDGTLMYDHSPMISSADGEILTRVASALPPNLSLKYQSGYDYAISRIELTGHGVRNPLTVELERLGLWGCHAQNKFIPEAYQYACGADRVALLQGLLDTDGCADRRAGIEFTTVSKQLAYDVRELVWSLGGKCSINTKWPQYTYRGERRHGQLAYRLYIQFHNPPFSPFWLSRKARRYKDKCRPQKRKLKSVEYVGQVEAQCIRVEDSLYITNDYIVTHNTCGVAIAALSYCALYPGFRFLNVAPTGAQADLMLGEIEKWCTNTGFRKFIKTSRGVNELWKEKPYPTITVDVYPGYPSTFVCQTVGRDARGIIGGERDWIDADESQLLDNIGAAAPILVTRLRGTRSTGMLRWGKLTWITNPGKNPELVALIEEYQDLMAKGHEDVLVMEDIDSSVNLYVTKYQLEKQKRTMSKRVEDRWHGGEMLAAFADTGIDEGLLNLCRDKGLDVAVEEIGDFDDFGLRHYDLPPKTGHQYVVVGDSGKSDLASMSSLNVPVVMVFDATEFLTKPCRMVAFHWLDGLGSYKTFIGCMKRCMLKYGAKGYYDAGNVQTAFEDLGEGGFEGWPTQPIYFGGTVSAKGWSLTILTQMMQEHLFTWPYIKGLWYQARIFDPSSRKRADDIIATLLVFCLALRQENIFWTMLTERFGWKEDDDQTMDEIEDQPLEDDRYARILDDR